MSKGDSGFVCARFGLGLNIGFRLGFRQGEVWVCERFW